MNKIIPLLCLLSMMVFSCMKPAAPSPEVKKRTILTTYSVLGAVIKDMVGSEYEVKSLIPNGLDVHEWEPSAKDIEDLQNADIVVENGLGLEGGLVKVLDRRRDRGRGIFTASSVIKIRKVASGEGIPSGDPDQLAGAKDPHLWMDPLTMRAVVLGFGQFLGEKTGQDYKPAAQRTAEKLENLDLRLREKIAQLPVEKRLLVTGHESVGYFAQAYGFRLLGAVVPGLTTQAQVSAGELADLKTLMQKTSARVIFTEVGTPRKVAQSLADELKIKTVEVNTHLLPEDGSYFTMMEEFTDKVVGSLR